MVLRPMKHGSGGSGWVICAASALGRDWSAPVQVCGVQRNQESQGQHWQPAFRACGDGTGKAQACCHSCRWTCREPALQAVQRARSPVGKSPSRALLNSQGLMVTVSGGRRAALQATMAQLKLGCSLRPRRMGIRKEAGPMAGGARLLP